MSIKRLRPIIQAKAEFLSYTGVALHARMERIRKLRIEAARIPDRRKADRERAAYLRFQANGLEEELANELGHSVLRTYKFVREHEELLRKKQKERLYRGGA